MTVQLTIIVPVRNEAQNLLELVRRVHSSLTSADISYRLIFVDDHSTDRTQTVLKRLARTYPITVHTKKGQIGKAYSILEGAKLANSPAIAMLDGDLQYPPEAIPAMFQSLTGHPTSGVIVANRLQNHTSSLRRLASRTYRYLFGRALLGFDCDVQSGLKLFRREVIIHVQPSQVTPWTLDVTLLATARNLGYSLTWVDIPFSSRKAGSSKVSLLQASWEIGTRAVIARLSASPVYQLPPPQPPSPIGTGLAHAGRRFVTHTPLAPHLSAHFTLVPWQKWLILSLAFLFLGGLVLAPVPAATAFVALLSAVYFFDVLFNLFLVLKSLHHPPELSISDAQLSTIDDQLLPVYSILCPLYREARVLPQFVEAVSALDWPKDKLEVFLLLEEDDQATISAANSINLPSHFRVLVVPHSQPKSKPKACNYGLAHATGQYVVIYDAEDRPQPDQLKKAYLAFRKVSESVVCLQSKLNYYNPRHNLLTRLFTAEYSLWFDIVLPGLQSIHSAIPLGGTSNHFKTDVLRRLHGWDAFNVTEDADLGARLFKLGYKTAIIDSITFEEATSQLGNWLRQRSRWIKGYIQTFFVHNRHPLQFIKTHGLHALIFQLVVGGKIAFMLINPILWLATISYFTLYRFVGPSIESLYPPAVFYMAVFSLVFGNFLFLYYYMLGLAKRRDWSLVKYVYFVPIYWLLISTAAVKAVWQLFIKPHYWEKTLHGFHLQSESQLIRRLFRFPSLRMGPRLAYLVDKLHSGFVSGAILITSSLIGSFFNLLYNIYLGRAVSIEDFGLVSLVGSFIHLTQMPLGALNRTVTHHSAYLFGKYDRPIRSFWQTTRRRLFLISLLPALGWLLLIPWLQIVFHSPDPLPFLLFAPVWVIAALESVDNGYLSGNIRFKTVGTIVILEAVSKFVFSFFLVSSGFSRWVYAAVPASMFLAFLVGWLTSLRIPSPVLPANFETRLLRFPWRFFVSSFLIKLTTLTFIGLDVILAKSFLPPLQAGAYALLSLAGKMIYMLGGQFSQFIIPIVSQEEGAGRSSASIFFKLTGATVAACMLGFITIGLFGYITAPVLWKDKAGLIIPYLPAYTLAISCFTVGSAIVTYHQMRHKNLLPIVGFALGLVQVFVLLLYHPSLPAFIFVINLTSIIGLGVIVLGHFLHDSISLVIRALADFVGLFIGILPSQKTSPTKESLRILVFNWRDRKHVWAGGAEEYLHQIARRWVASGHQVTFFCGNDGHQPRYEKLDGVNIVRRGGFFLVYLWAVLYYLLRFRGKYDVIIDSENGIPFFTPLYAKEKKVLVIHHVHQEVFRSSLPWYFAWLAIVLEKYLMPVVYRRTPVVTVSPSSKADILNHHLTHHDPQIVYNGVDLSLYRPGRKSPIPTVLYLGRLKAYKSLHIFLQAAKKVLEFFPPVQFIIAGDGEEKENLVKTARDLGISNRIKFLGRVSEKRKISLLQKAWLFVNPSLMEGWGITTIEANACGTPVIASNVGGLRDAVYNPHSGILVSYGNTDEFVFQIKRLISDQKERFRMNKEAVKWALKFDWDASATVFLQLVKNHLSS